MEKTSRENSMILPALYVMSTHTGGLVTTGELRKELRKLLNISDEQERKLQNRGDFAFDQIVRNFKSHAATPGNILHEGYAQNAGKGLFQITPKGRQFLNEHLPSFFYLLNNDFEMPDVVSTLADIHEQKGNVLKEIITEGDFKEQKNKTYARSRKLRQVAVEHFTHNGLLKCDCCGFETRNFYGEKYGHDSCIEIHHIKPVFLYKGEDMTKTIEKALKNLLPVCPNCHRIIHKKHITAELLGDFRKEIFQQSKNV